MAFIVKKKINGKDYFYLNETRRQGKKVTSKCLAYLGKTRSEAEKKAEEILKAKENKDKTIKKEKMNSLTPLKLSVEELSIFCKRKGFVYPSGEIYGGLSGFWDYGPLGVELKENIKKEWWAFHVLKREDIVGIDGAIITNPKVWEASGHVDKFLDFKVKNKKTGEIFKIDSYEKDKYEKDPNFELEGAFNPMFSTNVGPEVTKSSQAYLRPETAQLIFSNFKLVQDNARMKLPFGIAQKGKSFRNEIAPRDFIFRSREFEQMEIEYFIKPKTKCPYDIPDIKVKIWSAESQKANKEPEEMKISEALKKGVMKVDWHAYWLGKELEFFKNLGVNLNNFRLRQHNKNELAHYSSDCWDIEYNFPFGWKELEGIADRGDYDLTRHSEFSKKDLSIFDEETKEKILPEVVAEPSLGVERTFLVILLEAIHKNEKGETILNLNPRLSPIKAAVFPIVKRDDYEKIAQNILADLRKEWNILYDKSGSIGRRYARNDEAGTPYCITIDEESLKANDVTIRDRDTTKQIRVKVKDLRNTLRNLIDSEIEFENAGKIVP